MERQNNDKVFVLELYDVKFIHAMFNLNWNRKHFPFLGCYCQRGDSLKDGHTCRRMKDEGHLACYDNEALE